MSERKSVDRDGYCGACHGDGEVWSETRGQFVSCYSCGGTGWALGVEKKNEGGLAQLEREGGLEGVWE